MFSKLFSNVQETKWYRRYLDSIVEEIPNQSKILDIGTGSGKLLQILADEKSAHITGTDISQSMLAEAKRKLRGRDFRLVKTSIKPPYDLPEGGFNYITLSNILFLLSENERTDMLEEAIRLLAPRGKIIILSPSGRGGLIKLIKTYFSLANFSIIIWYLATKRRAKKWHSNRIEKLSKVHGMIYSRKMSLNGFGIIETIAFN